MLAEILAGLKALGDACKSIIGLKKDEKEAKKTDLEVKALEKKNQEEESPIKAASFEDVKQYDPKFRQIQSKAELRRNSEEVVDELKSLPFLKELVWEIFVHCFAFLLLILSLCSLTVKFIRQIFNKD
jgi:hypothetical protein